MKPEPRGSGQDSEPFERPMTHLHRRLTIHKYTGFDFDYKQTVVCVVQPGQPDRYWTLRTGVGQLRQWLKTQRGPGDRLDLSRRRRIDTHALFGWPTGTSG